MLEFHCCLLELTRLSRLETLELGGGVFSSKHESASVLNNLSALTSLTWNSLRKGTPMSLDTQTAVAQCHDLRALAFDNVWFEDGQHNISFTALPELTDLQHLELGLHP